jgi:hypothetical protein
MSLVLSWAWHVAVWKATRAVQMVNYSDLHQVRYWEDHLDYRTGYC